MACMVTFKQPYSEIMKMPTIERRHFLTKYKELSEEAITNAETKKNSEAKNLGNGRTTRTVSGK